MKFKASQEVDLGKEPVKHLLFMLAVPTVASQVVNALYNMVDRMYLGHIPKIGATVLTGVGVCFPIIMLVTAFATLIGMGGAPRASIYMGKQDNKTAEKILGNCFSALILISILLTGLILLFKRPVLYLFGASEYTIGYAEEYISIYSIGTIFVLLTIGLNSFISAQGFSKISMLTVVIGAVTNIILDPILIFGCQLGVKGAALATIFSQAISALWAVSFVCGKKTILRLYPKNMKIHLKTLLPCLALGIAPFIMMSTESVLILCFNSSLKEYGGDTAVGTMTILSSIMQFAMLPLQGITQGGQPIISYNYGAHNLDRVKKAFLLQTVVCFGYSTIIWLISECFPTALISVFADNAALVSASKPALRIYMSGVLLMGLQVSCQQTFIAFGNAKASCFLAILRKIILLIPLIYILPVFMEDKVTAVFLAEPIADFVAVATTVALFSISFRKLLKLQKSLKS